MEQGSDFPPYLWGPVTWQTLFTLAYTCAEADYAALRTLVFDLLPHLLPCTGCRTNALAADGRPGITYRRALKKIGPGRPRTSTRMLAFLHQLKEEVNHETRAPKDFLTPARLQNRLAFLAGEIDEVRLADALVLYAISAERRAEEARFVEMLRALYTLLPEGALRQWLAKPAAYDAVIVALRAAHAVRSVHGRDTFDLSHYESFLGGTK